jgi:hypothetical protein
VINRNKRTPWKTSLGYGNNNWIMKKRLLRFHDQCRDYGVVAGHSRNIYKLVQGHLSGWPRGRKQKSGIVSHNVDDGFNTDDIVPTGF